MRAEDIYLKCPVWLQQILINFQAYNILRSRFDNQFYFWLRIFNDSQPELINRESLYKFLCEANKTVFWKQRFKLYNLQLNSSDQIHKEIQKLPILSKSEVKEAIENIKNTNGYKIKWAHTSGTTGSGLVFPQTIEMEKKQWAVWWRYRGWFGLDTNTWIGWFGGRSIANINQKSPPYWRINYPMKQVMFSAYHLNEKTVALYFNEIKKRKLTWLHGYPSQLSLLAHFIKRKNLGILPKIKIITVGAENLLETQKQIIEEVFQSQVIQHYGLAEGVANISEHPDGLLKPDQDFAFTEFIPINEDEPSLCKIVGTNYSNPAFPLIRYDTGDIAHVRWELNGEPTILSIDGRQEDYVSLPNGIKLGRLDHIFKDMTEVQEAQIYQPSIDTLIIRIVKGLEYDKLGQETNVLSEARKRLGKDVDIKIEYLNHIPKTKSGKLKFVLSEVN